MSDQRQFVCHGLVGIPILPLRASSLLFRPAHQAWNMCVFPLLFIPLVLESSAQGPPGLCLDPLHIAVAKP